MMGLTQSIGCRGEASNDEKGGSASPTSSIHSYDSVLAEMPLQVLGTMMKLLPWAGDLPLTLVLCAADLFSDDQVETHHLHGVSWTLDFSEFPNYALKGIQAHNARRKRKRQQDAAFDGDSSGDFDASQIWTSKKRRIQKVVDKGRG
jgi:hypothetical protein